MNFSSYETIFMGIDIRMDFSRYFKNLLEDRNLTPTDFARKVGKDQSYISYLVRGQRKAPKPASNDPKTLTMPQVIAALDSVKTLTADERKMLMVFALERAANKPLGEIFDTLGIQPPPTEDR